MWAIEMAKKEGIIRRTKYMLGKTIEIFWELQCVLYIFPFFIFSFFIIIFVYLFFNDG